MQNCELGEPFILSLEYYRTNCTPGMLVRVLGDILICLVNSEVGDPVPAIERYHGDECSVVDM